MSGLLADSVPAQSTDRLVAGVHQDLRGCPHCGLFQKVPDTEPGETVRCMRCHAWLRHRRQDPTETAFACTLTCLVLYGVAMLMPLMTLDLFGRIHTVNILTGPFALWGEGEAFPAVGALVLLATVLVPGVVILLNLVLLDGARRETIPPIVPRLMRLRRHLRPWSMIEVYMLGIFVAYTKLIDLAHVEIGAAIWALAGIMVLMIGSDAAFDATAVWERIDRRRPGGAGADGARPVLQGLAATDRLLGCPDCGLVHERAGDLEAPEHALPIGCLRCGHLIHRRKPNSFPRTIAFLAAATVLYVPANLLPVLTLTRIGQGQPSTIMAGVIELYESHMLPLAVLVFFASICVPSLKVFGLAWMVISTRLRPAHGLIERTRLYRVIDFIGRWSMIDVFMISILVAIVHFGFLANVRAEPGCIAFAAVVVLTIFAADCFDPRLMWDTADRLGGDRGQTAAAARSEPVPA